MREASDEGNARRSTADFQGRDGRTPSPAGGREDALICWPIETQPYTVFHQPERRESQVPIRLKHKVMVDLV
jgi:hypothetical protein